MSNGNGGGFDIGSFLGGLGDVLSALVNQIIAAIIFLVNLLAQVFIFLYTLLVAVFQFLLKALTSIWHAFKDVGHFFMDNVIKPIVNFLDRAFRWLHDTIAPVLKWLKRLRQWYDDYFRRYVRPVLQVISRIRQMLVLLKIFHIKWASKLDNLLAKVQARIIHNFEVMRQRINQIITWIDIFTDPRGILRAGPLAASIGLSVGTIVATLTGRPLSFYEPTGGHHVTAPASTGSITQAKSDLSAAASGGSGFYADYKADGSAFVQGLIANG